MAIAHVIKNANLTERLKCVIDFFNIFILTLSFYIVLVLFYTISNKLTSIFLLFINFNLYGYLTSLFYYT